MTGIMNNKIEILKNMKTYQKKLDESNTFLNGDFPLNVKNHYYDQRNVNRAYYNHFKGQLELIILMESLENEK